MNCASCGRANRAGARFCGGCGASFAPRCPACNATNEPDARFCDACGAALGAATAPAHGEDDSVARKVVTIVFADLIGSTALQERLDPESVSRVMEAYHAAVRVPIEAHGGTLVQLLGDGVMCAFGVPQVAEDDALRAVRAGVAVQESFRAFLAERPELAGKVGLRVAVNTGEVVVSDDYAAGIGDPLNVAARLQQEARDGDVLLGESTQRHVREQVTLAQVGSFALKGRAEPVAAYRVVSLERPAGAAAVPFVGREDELRRLQAVYDAATSGPAPAARLAVLLGSPGLGKSRLVAEWVSRLEGRATLLSARCESGRGATFAPLAAALRELLGAHEEPAPRIAALLPADEPERPRIAAGVAALLAGEPALPQETFFVVRRFLAALAKTKPVLLMIDDLHWAEPLLLDLVEHLVQWGAGVKLLVLAAARPELRALRSSLATPGPLASDVLTLAGLDAAAATQLAARVIGADALPAAIAGRVLAASEGNPLFLAELVRMLVGDGVLRREGEQWVAGDAIADFPMPPSIHALLAARIERLAPGERTVLERAAIVGRRFSRSALAALLPRESADLDTRLEALRRSELIEPDTGWLLGEPALRFHHALIRDAAYRRVLKHTRAELHARIARWIGERGGEAVEHDETIGWHFEQAHQNLRELGPLDERGHEFGARAARHLGAAGQRALARDDLPLAAGLLGRALERLGPESPTRVELLLDHCEALLATGEVTAATQAVAELARLGAGSERLRAWHTCFAGQLAALTDPEALRATAEAAAAAAETLAAAGDAAGEAKAHSVHAGALARLGAIGACEAALDRALAAARRAGDRRRANAVLAGAPLAALLGPSPVTRASGRCLDVVRVLRITQGAPAVEAVALRCQAVLEALRERLDAARRMVAASRRLVEELGIGQQLLESDVFAGQIEWLAGDAVAAERWLRDAYTGMRQRGLRIDAARAAALLGRILLAQGRAGEAEALSHESESLAGDDLQAAIAWRGVRAEALAQRGEHAPAVALARGAVEIAAGTDALLHHADAHLALSAVLRAAGRAAEADAEEARAVELWEAKGATLLAERARRERRPPQAEQVPEAPRERPQLVRRVRANTAMASCERVSALIAARDADALPALVSDEMEVVHEPTRSVYGREEALRVWRSLIEAPGGRLAIEPLASLGDSLALCRHLTTASGAQGKSFDFGAYEVEHLLLAEVDAHGRQLRGEFFEGNRLAHAVVRLYEHHAELLREGPERDRAAATAHTLAGFAVSDFDRISAAIAPGCQYVDHRPLGFPPLHGGEAVRGFVRSLHEAADEVAFRWKDVLGLRLDAVLFQSSITGIDRASGGSFERDFYQLRVFDAAGRVTHWEQFDLAHGERALARFDALDPEAEQSSRRRVQPNAASANAERFHAAFVARDVEAMASLLGDDYATVHGAAGIRYGRSTALDGLRRFLLETEQPALSQELLATLGERLALARTLVTQQGITQSDLPPFGPTENENVALFEVDAQGRRTRSEFFATEHLGQAISRLYARHAELLPEGPERTRAAARAAAVARGMSVDDEAASDFEFVDRRRMGIGSGRGPEALQRGRRVMSELAEERAYRVHDVLALEPSGFLVAWTTSGRQRAGGGAFENHFLMLRAYTPDGRVRHVEFFDPDQHDEALARFEELTAGASRTGRFENAATRWMERYAEVQNAGDATQLATLHAPGFAMDDRRSHVRLALDREQALRRPSEFTTRYTWQPVATRGDRLALVHGHNEIQSDLVGPSEIDWLLLVEVNAEGQRTLGVLFDLDQRDAAYAELDARYEAGEGSGSVAWRELVVWAEAFNRRDFETLAARHGPELALRDHRPLGWGAVDGVRYVELLRSLVELSPDVRARIDHFRGCARGSLSVGPMLGTRDGGSFEMTRVAVHEYDASGRLCRLDHYEPEQLDAARARFAELSEPAAVWRLENAATRAVERLDEAWRALDIERSDGLLAPGFRNVDRRRIVATDLDRAAFLESFRPIFARATRLTFASEVLATRGDRLALFRVCSEFSEADSGPSEVAFLQIFEVDAQGRMTLGVGFDPDALDSATAELDERYGGPRAPTLFLRGVAAQDWSAVAALLAPDLVVHDHRPLGWETLRGPAAYLASLRALAELSPDARLRADHSESAVCGVLGIVTLLGTREGGAFELQRAVVMEIDTQERIRRIDFYELDQLAAARARFAELIGGPPAAQFQNAATRASDRGHEAWAARDWQAFTELYAPNHRMIDRQKRVQLENARGEGLASYRRIFEMASSQLAHEVLATRGERLALIHASWQGSDDSVGPSEIDWHLVVEVDARGNFVEHVVFDPEDLDAAYDELDVRYGAGEAAPFASARETLRSLRRSMNARDWEAMASLFAPGFVAQDHRPLGSLTLPSGGDYVAITRALLELAPDAVLRSHHVLALDERGSLGVSGWSGTREGGPFEIVAAVVLSLGPERRIRSLDIYGLDQLDAARARYAALRAAPAAPRIDTLAMRTGRQLVAALEALDWERIAAFYGPGFRSIDRQRTVQLESAAAEYLAAFRQLVETFTPPTTVAGEELATRGERLALANVRWTGSGASVGPSELAYLELFEVDPEGRFVLEVAFDPGDLDAAFAELDRRYLAGEAAAHPHGAKTMQAFRAAFASRDWEALGALFAADVEVRDQRRLGWEPIRGRAAYVASLRSLVELAPDARLRLDHVQLSARGVLWVASWVGTREGGAFETPWISVSEHDAGGVVLRFDQYDVDQLESARSRFEALRPDPLRIPPNAATRLSERLCATFATHDAEGFEALIAPGFHFDDRRRGVRMSGDRETLLASARLIRSAGSRPARTVLATAGERLALERKLWSNEKLGTEVETLDVFEIDAEGRLLASVVFDPDDRRAAAEELFVRYRRGEGSARVSPAFVELVLAMNARDAARARALLPDDFVFHDHRRTGVGRLGNADDYVASLVALWEQSSDVSAETLYYVADAPHASLNVGRLFGTLTDGGEFESPFVRLFRFRAGRFVGAELFEPEDLDRARARFEELRPDPLRIPPNAAVRAGERFRELALAGDWDALRRLCEPVVFEDRRQLFRTTGGCEMLVANARHLGRSVWERTTRTLLATAGDRLALHRNQFRGGEGSGPFEVDNLEVTEIDAEGRFVAAIVFDPEHRRAASEEMAGRAVRNGVFPRTIPNEVRQAVRARDLERARALVPPGFVYHDHRRVGAGRLESADEFVAWLDGLFESSRDAIIEALYVIASEAHGTLSVGHTFGTLVDGGPFESVWVQVSGPSGIELFDLEDLERARARFEALRADPLRIPPNAASDALSRRSELFLAQDWPALRALTNDSFVFEDRRRRALVSGGVELWIRNLEVVSAWPDRRTSLERIATLGERIELGRLTYSIEAGRVEGEFLRLVEVDAEGRLAAWIHFDVEDRGAAFEEAEKRFLAGEAAGDEGQAAIAALGRAVRRRDWSALRDCCTDDFVTQDYRRLGLSSFGIDDYVESLRALTSLAPDVGPGSNQILAWSRHGRVQLTRTIGTRDGGPFEYATLIVVVTRAGRIRRIEVFDPADAERALARFAELCASLP